MSHPVTIIYYLSVKRAALAVVIAGLMLACTPNIPPPEPLKYSQAPADFPISYYPQAKASGSKVLHINSKLSLVTIDVRRGGALARLGHDHIVASHDVIGYVDVTAGRADLYVVLDRLTVDEPSLRAEAGLTTQLSEEAIAGTKRNMLDKVLESSNFPFALIRVIRNPTDHSSLTVTITLHGTMKAFQIPAQIETNAAGLKINGEMTFNQSDFGITPFSILGGALQVEDRLNLRFQIVAVNNSY
jgi:hypothetical protein